MKNFIKIIIFSSLLAATLLHTGCNKDNTSVLTNPTTNTTLQKEEMIDNIDEIKEKIEDFRGKIESMKNGENVEMNLDSENLVWNIEAILNATYGWGNFKYAQSSTETKKIAIGKQKDFNSEDILRLYQESHNQLRDHYRKLENERIRQLILADIDIVDDKDGRFLTVTSVYGTSQDIEAASRADDDYDASRDKSFCPTKPSSPIALENNINATRQVPPLHSYFINIENKSIMNGGALNPNGPTPGTQRRKYLLYNSRSTASSSGIPFGVPGFTCYSTDDHNWYLQNWKTFINQLKPSNKYLASCYIGLDGLFPTDSDGTKVTTFYHFGNLRYGTSVPMNMCCPPPTY